MIIVHISDLIESNYLNESTIIKYRHLMTQEEIDKLNKLTESNKMCIKIMSYEQPVDCFVCKNDMFNENHRLYFECLDIIDRVLATIK